MVCYGLPGASEALHLDERADGQGKAATTWIAMECLPEGHRWNPEEKGTEGGWEACELRSYLNESVLPAIPVAVRSRLISVKKTQRICGGSSQTSNDSIWIPDYDEVFDKQSLYYDLFLDSDSNK